MTARMRSERTANLLVAHLEALARAAPRMRSSETKRLTERAAVATQRAVTLQLLPADRATAIWLEAQRRHASLPAVELAFAVPLAA